MSAGRGEAPDLAGLQVRPVGPVGRLLARRPAVGDAALIACFAAWALVTGVGADSMYALHVHLGSEQVLRMQAASLALTAAGCALLVARRRRPVVVAAGMAVLGLAALALTGAPSGIDLGLALALHAVAVARRPLVTWAVLVPAVAAMLTAARILPLPLQVGAVMSGLSPDTAAGPDPFLGGWQPVALPVLVLALLAVAVGTGVRSRRLHLARIVEAAEAVAREAEQRTRLAEAAERARIAREMHDVVAHSISVMVALGGGASMALDWAPDRARLALDELVGTGRTALADMRRVLGVLHDAPADAGAPADASGDGAAAEPSVAPLPGIRDLAPLLDRFRLAGLPVRATGIADPRLARADATLQLAVHRIVQEALTNALRHAPGTAGVEVAIHALPGRIEVVVADEGPGIPVERTASSGRGVLGMRERAAAFGGTVDAGPHGRGWAVRAVLPVDEEDGA
ncbi:sensor histidine kinase [Clavibacter sp. km3a]|uniref:sensor histidine kinase n=1 Tax=Clavibacter sp. km3a TaxID=3459135 RepID=UPI004041113C